MYWNFSIIFFKYFTPKKIQPYFILGICNYGSEWVAQTLKEKNYTSQEPRLGLIFTAQVKQLQRYEDS